MDPISAQSLGGAEGSAGSTSRDGRPAQGSSPQGANPLAPSSGLPFTVVGLGASAGGLAALSRLLEAMPAAPGMAFVVVMHLSPKHESSVAEILQKSTRMDVVRLSKATAIQRNTVYVLPPTHSVQMYDGHLSLGELEKDRGRHVVIDLFFRTLAQAHKERAVAVVLSGTGADGSAGIAEVKEQGGIVIAQAPEDAEFDGMPVSAISTGKVDIILPVSEMAQRLLDIWNNAQKIELPDPAETGLQVLPPTSPEAAEKALREIMLILQARTGHDFKHYKRATVLRRIERRLQVNGLPHLPAYQRYLDTNPAETALLLGDMLIGVTNFFRDRDAFEAVERTVIPDLFAEHLRDEQLRVWVPGCSSGEEAYSLLMLIHQEMLTTEHTRPVQVFASDIDEHAIATGREGKYPESVVTDIPPTLLRRFMTKEGNGYRVTKLLRDGLLFAQHNILRDPPFSRLDVVSCRNLLIYLDREVQKDILQMFHFALRPGGYLFLGSSETADATSRLFSVVDKKHRIYRANSTVRAVRALPRFPLGGVEHRPVEAPPPVKLVLGIGELHQQLLEDYAPPSLIVRPDGEILHSSRAEHYLRYATGVPTQLLSALALPELRPALRTTLFQAAQSQETVQAPAVALVRDGRHYTVVITVRPLQHLDWPGDLLLVLFHETEDKSEADAAAAQSAEKDPLLHQMEAEMQRKDAQLQRVIAQYETSVEDLKASNEELQAINEELRSATEELETSKEELQSTNEELITVNHELKTKVDETAEINDDLHNLIASTEIATVFVDREMRIKRFTPAAARIFSIIGSDIGRSLLDITHKLDYDQLSEDAAAAFNSLRVVEREIGSVDGRWFLARLLPYRTAEDRIDGAVLTFVDITTRRSAERNVHIDQERMQLIAASMPDFAIMTMDEAGLVTSWSAGAERLFGYAESEMLGLPIAVIFTPEDRAAGMPEKEMSTALEAGRALDERWHQRKDGSTIFVSGIMSSMRLGRLKGFAKIARDVTAKRQEEASKSQALSSAVHGAAMAEQESHKKDEFLAVMSHELKHPLNLIQVNTQLLLASAETKNLPVAMKIGRTIQSCVRSQARIIDDLMDISRSRMGKLKINASAIYLDETLTSTLAWAREQCATKGIAFTIEPSNEPLLIHADPVRIEQVAMNLLTNAVKFTSAGGSIRVRTRLQGDEAVLTVADTGRGIASQYLSEVFELYKQGGLQPAPGDGGMGIGLALARDIVGLHGGHLDAASPGAGLGATFTLRLPTHARTDFGAFDEIEAPTSLQGLRILYVDDSVDTLESFGALLGLEGVTVIAALGGHEALQLAEATPALDLILSDVGMPRMDGYQLIAELRRRPETAHVPAIALTGYGRPQDVQQALEAGFNAHLNKPIEMGRLKAAVRSLLQGK
jgi:two-component system CheB/CheR fusion protein